MIKTIFESPLYMALSIIVLLINVWLLAFGGIGRIWNCYITKWPFRLKFLQQNEVGLRQKFFSKKIVIGVINPVFPTKIEFEIIPRRKLIFEQVSFRLEGNRWWRVNEPKDTVSIEEIKDINIDNEKRHFRYTVTKPRDNIKRLMEIEGGIIGQYPVPEICPKGGSLLLEIELHIKIKKRWKGYIIFKHLRGEDYQHSARLPIEFYLAE